MIELKVDDYGFAAHLTNQEVHDLACQLFAASEGKCDRITVTGDNGTKLVIDVSGEFPYPEETTEPT